LIHPPYRTSLAIVAVHNVYDLGLLMFSRIVLRSWALAGCTLGEKVVAHLDCSQPDHTAAPEHTAVPEYMVAFARTAPDCTVAPVDSWSVQRKIQQNPFLCSPTAGSLDCSRCNRVLEKTYLGGLIGLFGMPPSFPYVFSRFSPGNIYCCQTNHAHGVVIVSLTVGLIPQ
jgi:hypothetical protein